MAFADVPFHDILSGFLHLCYLFRGELDSDLLVDFDDSELVEKSLFDHSGDHFEVFFGILDKKVEKVSEELTIIKFVKVLDSAEIVHVFDD